MAVYSTRNRLTGLSGIDTETMISQLMKAETLKLNKLQKNSTKLAWKQEAYWTAADSLKSFQAKYLDSLSSSSIRMTGTFNKYNTTVMSGGAPSNAVKVLAGGSNAGGTYKLSVSQLAVKDTYTTKVGSDGAALGSLKGSIESKADIDLAAIQADGASFKLNLDGVIKTIEISKTEGSSLNNTADLATLIQNKVDTAFGANKVNIGANGDKLSMQPIGSGHTLSISEGSAIQQKADAAGTANFANLKTMLKNADAKQTIKFSTGGKDVEVEFDFSKWSEEDFDAADLDKILSEMNKQMTSKGVSAQFESDGTGNVSVKTTSLSRTDMVIADNSGNSLMSELGFGGGTANLKKTSSLADLNIVSGDSNHLGADDKLKEVGLLSSISFTDTIVDDEGNTQSGYYKMKINNTEILLHEDDSVDDMVKKINTTAGTNVTMTYDKLKETFTLQAKSEGANNAIAFDANAENLFTELGFEMGLTERETAGYAAQDAKFTINGVETTRDSNNFTYNGVTFTLNERTTQEVTIEVVKDNSSVKQVLTDFVNAYNGLIEGLNGLVNETRAKTKGGYYEPLTDEEKKAMSEDEIKKWETTAKQGLLNRDSIISGITASMRSQLYQSVTLEDGSKIALYQIGITTSNDYKDQGKLVIDEAALEAAIEKYGDKISEMFNKSAESGLTGAAKQASMGIGERLNSIVDGAINSAKGSISMKAGAKVGYTSKDNDLLNQITAESRKINDMMIYLANREDHYYSMFAKLEAAISQNDSQMSYLSQMFGM